MTRRVLITGANRGIGLEMTRQYLADGWAVNACCRSPENADDLARLAQAHSDTLTLHPLDVTNATQIDALKAAMQGLAIDVLVNNAGIYGPRGMSFGNVDTEAWARVFAVNTMAPLKITEALADCVAASETKLVAMVSSKMGSIADNGSGGNYVYRSSKAALNAVTKSAALDLADRGITVVVLHPGWVRTAMGGDNAMINSETSVRQLRAVLADLTRDDSGRFIDRDGSTIPW